MKTDIKTHTTYKVQKKLFKTCSIPVTVSDTDMDTRDISVSPLEFGYPNYNQTAKWIEGNSLYIHGNCGQIISDGHLTITN